MLPAPKHNDGIELQVAGDTYVFPVLPLGFIEANMQRLWVINYAKDPQIVLDVLMASLWRNYPDLTREEVAKLFDFPTAEALMNIIIKASCLPWRDESGNQLSLEQLKKRISNSGQASENSMPIWPQVPGGPLSI